MNKLKQAYFLGLVTKDIITVQNELVEIKEFLEKKLDEKDFAKVSTTLDFCVKSLEDVEKSMQPEEFFEPEEDQN